MLLDPAKASVDPPFGGSSADASGPSGTTPTVVVDSVGDGDGVAVGASVGDDVRLFVLR